MAMKNIKRSVLITLKSSVVATALIAGMVTFTPTTAEAWKATEVTLQRVRSEVSSVRRAVDKNRKEVFDTGTRIIEALRLSRAEGSSYVDKQIEATKRMLDAQEMNNVQMQRDLIRAEAEGTKNQPNPGACLLAGLFGGSGGAGGAQSSGVGSSIANSARDQMSGGDPTVYGPKLGSAKAVIDAAREHEGHRGSADPTTDLSLLLTEATFPADEASNETATRYLRNVINPVPPRPISEEEMKTPEGYARAAEQQRTRARQSAIHEVFAFSLNLREPKTPYNDEFKKYVEQSHYNRDVPETLSELQAIDIRTVRHYAPKTEFASERSNLSQKGVLLEVLDAISIGNRIAYLQLEQSNRDMILNSIIAARLMD